MTSRTAEGRPGSVLACEAAVVGGGVAGLAAAIHLRQGGLSVLCIEPEPFPHLRVGESLDWSSPGLLAELGLSRDALVGERVATFKRGIKVVWPDGIAAGRPPRWWGKPPLRFENLTLHVDRQAMDDRLYARAREVGVEFLWDRAARVAMDGQRVAAVETTGGRRVEAAWFVDATGRNVRLFARQLGIRRVDYGREKVSFWCYLETPCENEGTTFYVEGPGDDYLSWIWEIPINPTTASVGCVLPVEVVKAERRQGRRPDEILRVRLARFPRFAPLLAGRRELEVRATAYRCFVHRRACGPNWVLAGESVSLPDALTGNGVTAAFRHAAEGAHWILDARARGRLSRHQRRVYDRNVGRMGRMFNHSIETAVYRAPIRRGLGLKAAQSIYVSCAFTLNALYTRFRPRRRVSMLVFGLLMAGAWIWIESWSLLGRLAAAVRRLRGAGGRPVEAEAC